MVAAAPAPLTPEDQTLLTTYIALRFNLIEFATYTKRPLLDLQDWALQPHIQQHIARYRRLEKLQHETETADARSAGITALLDILSATKDPIERRRAAQTLIRVGSPPSEPRRAAAPAPRAIDHSDLDLDAPLDAEDLNETAALPSATDPIEPTLPTEPTLAASVKPVANPTNRDTHINGASGPIDSRHTTHQSSNSS